MKLLNKNNGTLMPVLNFEFMPGGGMRGMIDGHSVICGSAELMRLMQVKLPYKLLTKTTVLLSVDGILYGLFDIQYDPKHSVREALIELMKSQRHPVFAIKDFNITPEMINQVYDLPTDGYDFPPYSERYKMTKTDPEETGQVAAVVCMEGLGPFAKAINMGTRLHKCVVTNLIIAMAASIIGIVTVFVMMLSGGIAALSIRWLFIYMMAVLASIFITGLTALE
jgi:cation transport ATPase